jgi:hypothetical protein
MEPPMVVPMSSLGAIGLRPTTMMGWCFGAVFDGPDGLLYAFSCGGADAMKRGAKTDDCRALAITATSASYIGRGGGDEQNILSADHSRMWASAMADRAAWHHLAVADDGKHIELYLDGELVGDRAHDDPNRKTGPGFIIGGACELPHALLLQSQQFCGCCERTQPAGRVTAPSFTFCSSLTGFADCNRAFVGSLAGVRFYGSCLGAADILAAKQASVPRAMPKPPAPPAVKTCLYRGPLLLTYDPRLNGLARLDLGPAPLAPGESAIK